MKTALGQPNYHRRTSRLSRLMSLRFVMVVPFVLQICIAVGLTSWFSLHHGQKAVNEFATQLQDRASAGVVHHVEDLLTTPERINQINLDLSRLKILDLDNLETMGQVFWHQMNLFDVGYINYANKDGEFIGVERLDNGQLLINETRSPELKRLSIYTTDDQGNRTFSAAEDALDPIQGEGWYADAAQAGKPVWSHIYQWDDKPDVLSISSSYPVYNAAHQLQGVLGVDLILSDLNQFLRQNTASPCSKTFIMERSGLLVATSNHESAFRVIKQQMQQMSITQSQDPVIQATAQYLLEHFGTWQRIQSQQSLEFYMGRERQYVQITPWHDAKGLDWLIVVVVPESDFMAQIYVNAQKTILLSLLSLALATLFGLMTSNWIEKRLRQLVRASQAIASGDLDQTINVRGIRELELLSRSFNQMAATLKASFTDLESRVNQRTAELAAAKDAAVQEAARSADANRAKSEFLATMSHELRTPLNAILGFAQVMQHDLELQPTHQDYLDIIRRSGEHLLALINDVLKASKLEVGQVCLQKSNFDLYHLLDTLYRMMQLRADGKGLQLIVDCAPDVPQYIHTDANKLRQILINLLDNAIKFTETGKVTLRVWSVTHQKLGTVLSFAVEDTGIGIHTADLGTLFEPFVQAKTGYQAHQGTGLGLYISHRFAHLMGGELVCQSEVNRGSCFRFTIEVGPAWLPTRPHSPKELAWVADPATHSMEASDTYLLSMYLAQMSPEWIAQLYQAAIKGFDHAIIQLTDQIPSACEPLAQQLKVWASDFQFDPVIELIQEMPE